MPIGAVHPSHVNVQQFQIGQIEGLRKNLNVNLEPHTADGAVSDAARQDGIIETQMERRLRSTIAREDPNSAMLKPEASEKRIKVAALDELGNKTGTRFTSKQRTSNLDYDEAAMTKQAESRKAHPHGTAERLGDRPKLPQPYPEIRQQSQGVIRSSRQNNMGKHKESQELSVSTLSNEDFRKRQRSQLKAKYKQGVMVSSNLQPSQRSKAPGGGSIDPTSKSGRGASKQLRHESLDASMTGSYSRKKLEDEQLSDSAPMINEINTDISQFLNTKQTFNHSLTGVTNSEERPEAILDQESALGGVRFGQGTSAKVARAAEGGQGAGDQSPRIPSTFNLVPTQAQLSMVPGPGGAFIFNHNHPGTQTSSNTQNRHVYTQRKSGGPGSNTLNRAGNMLVNQQVTFGKFGQKHVLNKYGRPIVQNRNMTLGRGQGAVSKNTGLKYLDSTPHTTRGQSFDNQQSPAMSGQFQFYHQGETFQAGGRQSGSNFESRNHTLVHLPPTKSFADQPSPSHANADLMLNQMDHLHIKHGKTQGNSPRAKNAPVATIHPVVMGDFQLQDWRSIQKVKMHQTPRASHHQLMTGRSHMQQASNTMR